MAERQIDELKFLDHSSASSAGQASGGSTPPHANHNSCTSSEGEEYPSLSSKGYSDVTENALTVSLTNAEKLSEYHSNLSTRLQQLQIESDLTIRAAMDGIGEVLDMFRVLRLRRRRSSENRTSFSVSF